MLKYRIALFVLVNFLQLAISPMLSYGMENFDKEDHSINWRLMALDSNDNDHEEKILKCVCEINKHNVFDINNILIDYDKIMIHCLTNDEIKHLRDKRQKFRDHLSEEHSKIQKNPELSGKIKEKQLEIIFAEKTYNGKNIIPVADLLEMVLQQSVTIKITKKTLISVINAVDHREDVKRGECPDAHENKKNNLPPKSMNCGRFIDLFPKSVRQVTIKIYDKKYTPDRIKRIQGFGDRSITIDQYIGDYLVKSDTFYIDNICRKEKIQFFYSGLFFLDKSRYLTEQLVYGNKGELKMKLIGVGTEKFSIDTKTETEFELETETDDCACVLI